MKKEEPTSLVETGEEEEEEESDEEGSDYVSAPEAMLPPPKPVIARKAMHPNTTTKTSMVVARKYGLGDNEDDVLSNVFEGHDDDVVYLRPSLIAKGFRVLFTPGVQGYVKKKKEGFSILAPNLSELLSVRN